MHSPIFPTLLAALTCACIGTCSATASTIPYGDVGSEAAAHTFRATTTGDLTAYFAGTTATYTDTLGLNVNGVLRTSDIFDNKTTAEGAAFDFGKVNAGDVLTFFIKVQNTGDTFSSDKGGNADGLNHVYATSFSGSAAIPVSGTFVAFEDLYGGGDLNYNDETFVFTNTAAVPVVGPLAAATPTLVSAVPLPGSAPMFGAALLALGAAGFGMKRRVSAKG